MFHAQKVSAGRMDWDRGVYGLARGVFPFTGDFEGSDLASGRWVKYGG